MEDQQQEITIIGCGISGLSCGIRLLQAGFGVSIIARDLPPQTTSNWAAAIWFPYNAFPKEKVLGWSATTFNEYQEMMKDGERQSVCGVRNTQFLELFDKPMPDPWWKSAVSDFRHATQDELLPGYGGGFVITVPVIDSSVHMEYLVNQFTQLGGTIEQREISDLGELADHELVVNCAGLGSRELLNDTTVFPIRGQVIRVKADGIPMSYLDEFGERPTYIIPRFNDIILGGTAQENNWNLEPDPATADAIWESCRALVPQLENATILEHGVGLRPGRPQVRLEPEKLADGRTIIHNYGHGGAGFTLAWGCADEVVQLVQQHI